MSSNSSNLSLTRKASASRCDNVDNHPVQNSQSAGAYVVPWKRCTLCWPSDSAGPFRSPRDFCRHLRDYHCTREGGSFVCRYGMNDVCPSLPVEGVSDRDYEDHVARDHVAGESCISSQASTDLQSNRKDMSTMSVSSRHSSSRSPTPGGAVSTLELVQSAPSVVRDQLQWTIFMSRVNLPAVLNDPTLARRETDFFKKTWGEDFEKSEVPPSSHLPHITRDNFRKYLAKTSARYRKHTKLSENLPVVSAAEASGSTERNLAVLIARNQSKLPTELDAVPKIFQQPGFSLQNPETFNAVIPWNQATPSKSDRSGKSHQSSKLLQERLSHYLDVVEIQIADQISRRSEAFFDAMISHDELQDHMRRTCDVIRYLREKVGHLDDILVKNPLRILRLKTACANHVTVYEKLKLMATVHQTQPNIQMLLATSDYVGALDLITATQDILMRDLAGIQSFRHLSSQLVELERMIDNMMQEEFLQFCTHDLNRPITEHRTAADEERLVTVVLGALRQHKYEFIDVYKEEASTTVKAVVKQTVIEAVAAADDVGSDGLNAGLANQMRMLNYNDWMKLFTTLFSNLMIILGRVRSFTVIVHDIVKSSCEADAVDIECPLPSVRQSTDAEDVATSDSIDLEWKQNIERRISLANDTAEQVLSQGEYLRVSGLLHEMLCAICDQAHDRCHKLLVARSKDGFLERLTSNEFICLSQTVDNFVTSTEQVSGRRCTTLRTTVQNQAHKYIGRFHEEHRTKLSLILDNERWKQADVPAEFQDLVDHISSLGVFSLPTKKPEIDKQPHEFLVINGEQYVVVGTVLMLLKMVIEYCQLASDIPSASPEILNRLIELLKMFNSRTCQLILGAGALHLVGLKNINTKNLGLASRCLQLVVHYLPMLRQHFEQYLTGKQLNMLKHLDHLLKDYSDHISEISNKLVAIMDSMLEMNISKWEVKAPMPSSCFRAIVRQISKLHEAIYGLLPSSQVQELFQCLHSSFKQILQQQLKKLGVTRDGGPQHGLVMSDVAYYTTSLRALPGLADLDVGVDNIWDDS